MATIKDIAVLAGVSHGTVSNVLNKRGNVSVEKINMVEKAARELGFKLNTQAKQLRQGRTERVGVIIPRINLKRYNDLFVGMNNELKEQGYEVDIYYSNDINHYEEELLIQIESTNPIAIVVVSSFVKNLGIFNDINNLIFVERYVDDIPKSAKFISFDYRLSGNEVGKRCLEDGARNIAIFTGNKKFSNNKLFIEGITHILNNQKCDYKIFSVDETMSFNAAFDIMTSKTKFDAIITTDIEKVELLRTIQAYNQNISKPRIYTLASTDIMPDNDVIKYELNYQLCGKKIAKYIKKIDKDEKISDSHLEIENDGFHYNSYSGENYSENETLNVLTLASPTSEAIKKLLPNFFMKTGIKVNLIQVGYDDLYKTVKSKEDMSLYDLIRLDMAWLSEVGNELFIPLDTEEKWFNDIKGELSNLPDDYYKVGEVVYSLPLDPSVQILYYRKDLFEDSLIKREFYEKYKRQLELPKNFEEYNEVAAFFTKNYRADSPTDYGTSLVFGNPTVAACDYLPRLKELGGTVVNEFGEIELTEQVVKQALENYIEGYKYTDQQVNMWWTDAAEVFSTGNVAMNILFSNYASSLMYNLDSNVIGKIGFAPVPGNQPLLGGGVIGISKLSKKHESCKIFLKWIYDEKTAAIITRLGGYINNRKLLNHADIFELYPWIEGMEKAFATGWRRKLDFEYNNFNEFKIEEILGKAVKKAVLGIAGIDEALDEAQKSCNKKFS
jgi:multiple sugar transport system substrate-binding protein